jgi:bifunctional N-acetylglucosamine-1-phosphate-uridyltransferase/glucosamine-1-phosphate-acetyltransferase GlmU-like protein
MQSLETYFPELSEFAHNEIFSAEGPIWSPLDQLESSIQKILQQESGNTHYSHPLLNEMLFPQSGTPGKAGAGIYVSRVVELKATVFLEKPQILIGAGTLLEPTAIIKGPAVIGNECEIRQGAYIRGNVIVGKNSIIGHATEVKNSIIMNHSEAGHFNYIGDSILGNHVNMGAGSRLANLQFRSAEEKTQGYIHEIQIPIDGQLVHTERSKLGAILGDHVEIGCNAVLCPGTFLGHRCWVYPNSTVPKGEYPPQSMLAPENRKLK